MQCSFIHRVYMAVFTIVATVSLVGCGPVSGASPAVTLTVTAPPDAPEPQTEPDQLPNLEPDQLPAAEPQPQEDATPEHVPGASPQPLPEETVDQVWDAVEQLDREPEMYHQYEGWEFLKYPDHLYPGARYFTDDKGMCSAGWFVSHPEVPNVTVMLTAGHCLEQEGEEVSLATRGGLVPVGQTVWKLHDGAAGDPDWALVAVEPGQGNHALPWAAPHVSGWVGAQWLEENQPYICRLGFRTGMSCGEFISVEDGYLLKFGAIADSGDSGGPVFALDPHTGEWWAAGLLSFSSSWRGETILSGAVLIEPVMSEFGLQLH